MVFFSKEIEDKIFKEKIINSQVNGIIEACRLLNIHYLSPIVVDGFLREAQSIEDLIKYNGINKTLEYFGYNYSTTLMTDNEISRIKLFTVIKRVDDLLYIPTIDNKYICINISVSDIEKNHPKLVKIQNVYEKYLKNMYFNNILGDVIGVNK